MSGRKTLLSINCGPPRRYCLISILILVTRRRRTIGIQAPSLSEGVDNAAAEQTGSGSYNSYLLFLTNRKCE